MKSIKYLVVLVCMMLGLANVAKAQISSNEVLFFQKIESGGKGAIHIVRLDNGKLHVSTTYTQSSVKRHLSESSSYYDRYPYGVESSSFINDYYYVYDADMSANYPKIVYQSKRTINKNNTNRSFYAFSSDMSSMVYFKTQASGEAYGKEYYTRISKEDLLPKAFNSGDYDFLND